MFIRDHEKFIAFVLLGAALVFMAAMVYLRPLPGSVQNGAALAILNTIVGALTLAFGGAANALFKITSSEKAEIGAAAASALKNNSEPLQTTVVNTDAQPVPVEPTGDNNGNS